MFKIWLCDQNSIIQKIMSESKNFIISKYKDFIILLSHYKKVDLEYIQNIKIFKAYITNIHIFSKYI